MSRPPARTTPEQERLLKDVNRALDHARKVAEQQENKIWAIVEKLRDTGLPDTKICQRTGLNRATLQRRLGPRPSEQAGDSAE